MLMARLAWMFQSTDLHYQDTAYADFARLNLMLATWHSSQASLQVLG